MLGHTVLCIRAVKMIETSKGLQRTLYAVWPHVQTKVPPRTRTTQPLSTEPTSGNTRWNVSGGRALVATGTGSCRLFSTPLANCCNRVAVLAVNLSYLMIIYDHLPWYVARCHRKKPNCKCSESDVLAVVHKVF